MRRSIAVGTGDRPCACGSCPAGADRIPAHAGLQHRGEWHPGAAMSPRHLPSTQARTARLSVHAARRHGTRGARGADRRSRSQCALDCDNPVIREPVFDCPAADAAACWTQRWPPLTVHGTVAWRSDSGTVTARGNRSRCRGVAHEVRCIAQEATPCGAQLDLPSVSLAELASLAEALGRVARRSADQWQWQPVGCAASAHPPQTRAKRCAHRSPGGHAERGLHVASVKRSTPRSMHDSAYRIRNRGWTSSWMPGARRPAARRTRCCWISIAIRWTCRPQAPGPTVLRESTRLAIHAKGTAGRHRHGRNRVRAAARAQCRNHRQRDHVSRGLQQLHAAVPRDHAFQPAGHPGQGACSAATARRPAGATDAGWSMTCPLTMPRAQCASPACAVNCTGQRATPARRVLRS